MGNVVTWSALILGALGYLIMKLIDNAIKHVVEGGSIAESRRDSDKERMEGVIFEIRDKACDYWCDPISGIEQIRMAASISARLTFLGSRIEELFGLDTSEYEFITSKFYLFHIACTGHEFDVDSRSPEPERSVDIELYAYHLIHAIDQKRRSLRRRFW